jgi:hypothetical protein
MKKSTRALIALLAFLSGCATPHPITLYANRINEQKVCCTSLQEASFAALSVGTKYDFSIDSDSPVFLFKDGRSRFAAIQLPRPLAARKLRLESHVVPIWIEPTAFSPFVMFINKNHESMGEVIPTLRFKNEFFAGRFWEGELSVPDGAAYAVIYTKPVLYLTFMYHNPERSFAIIPGKIPLPIVTQPVPIMAGPHGKISLELIDVR